MGARAQVVIVGGGPVGAALALDLGLRGVSCVLLEARTLLHRIPKGQGLTHRSLESFRQWGVADEIRAARLMPQGYPIGEITAYGNLASDYWQAPAGRELVRDYFYEANERLPQYRTEEVLRRRLATLPSVEVRLGCTARSIQQDAKGVRVDVEWEDGRRESVEGDYAVGCDGARSMVREQSGIGRAGTDFDQLMVLAVFRSRELHRLLERFPPRSTYRVMRPGLNGYWMFFGRVDVGEGWFFHAPVPRSAAASGYDATALIQDAAGAAVRCEFDHVGFWELRVSVAERYRDRRVFVAGDAAHSHPPYGGFGLNNGLEDAVNLGWKLRAALAGWGGEGLLDSYDLERRPVFRDIGEDFIAARIRKDAEFFERHDPSRDRADFEKAWKGRETDVGSRLLVYEPHYEGSPVVAGPPGAKSGAHGEHRFAARAGHHLAPRPLTSGRNVFQELSTTGYTLLGFDAPDAELVALESGAKAAGVPLKVVRDDARQERADYAARLVLVRPDQFVGWTGASAPGDPRALFARLAGR